MTLERNPAPPAEPAPAPVVGSVSPASASTPVQIRLQILSTEHWSLLASRSLAWNEVFARAGMYLSTLSGAMVALGLIAGADGFHDAFFVFALVLLPVVEFIGIGTWIRMGVSNYHDAMTIFGMNRIRGAYLEIAPDLEPYFVMGVHDDARGIGITMGVAPGTPTIAHLVASTPFLVVVLNAIVAGAIAAVVLVRFADTDAAATAAGGILVAAIVLVTQMIYARRRVRQGQALVRPMFPTPPPDADRPAA
ncbi:MAG TPA: hypothetical protein VGJ71_12880 [Candidatus Limnocylindrales bacterium]|jgi:hypothetical protein